MSSATITALFGGLVAVGGMIGYVKKRSVPSLLSGLAFGAIYAYLALTLSAAGNPAAARPVLWARLGVSTVLAAVMGVRAARAGKVMPAGAVAGAATLMSAWSVFELQ